MSNVYQYKVRLGVVLMMTVDGTEKILLVRQNNRPFWVFPGGTLECDEGMAECAIREIKEEVNLEITINKLLYLADFLQGDGRHTIDVFMRGRYISGTPLMETSENINEMGFFTRDEFLQMPVEPQLAAQQVGQDWATQFAHANGLYLGKYGHTG